MIEVRHVKPKTETETDPIYYYLNHPVTLIETYDDGWCKAEMDGKAYRFWRDQLEQSPSMVRPPLQRRPCQEVREDTVREIVTFLRDPAWRERDDNEADAIEREFGAQS